MFINHVSILSTIQTQHLTPTQLQELTKQFQQIEKNSLLFSKCLFFHIYQENQTVYIHQGFEDVDEYFFFLDYHSQLWKDCLDIDSRFHIQNKVFGTQQYIVQYQTLMDSFSKKNPLLSMFTNNYCSRLFMTETSQNQPIQSTKCSVDSF